MFLIQTLFAEEMLAAMNIVSVGYVTGIKILMHPD